MVINPETIEFDSLESLQAFIIYQKKAKIGKNAGFLLAENLLNQKGGILYPQGMDLDEDRIVRLQRLHENNPEWEFSFSLQKNDKLCKTLLTRILGQCGRIIKSRKGKQEYRRLYEKIEKMLEMYTDEIFKPDDFVYALYQAWFTESINSESGRNLYFLHLLSSMLLSLGVIQQAHQTMHLPFGREDYVKAAQTSLLRNIAGVEGVAFAKKKTPEQLFEMYVQANGNSAVVAGRLQMPPEVLEAVKYCSEHDKGNYDFIDKDTPESKLANIVITADYFDLKVMELFSPAEPPQRAADKMYVEAQDGKFVKVYVDSLAKGMRFGQLFDFYFEIERLNNACTFGPGKLGRPYPMTGVKSPVIYVCGAHKEKCEHFSVSTKSVTIFKKVGDLEEGSYGRCEFLSKQLIKFYDEYYE